MHKYIVLKTPAPVASLTTVLKFTKLSNANEINPRL